MAREGKNPLEWLRVVAADIVKTKVNIGGIPYWNKNASKLSWFLGAGARALSTLNQLGLLKREIVGTKSAFFQKLPPKFVDSYTRNVVHIYRIMDIKALKKIASGEMDLVSPMGLQVAIQNLVPMEISYLDALQYLRKQIASSRRPDEALGRVMRELSKA